MRVLIIDPEHCQVTEGEITQDKAYDYIKNTVEGYIENGHSHKPTDMQVWVNEEGRFIDKRYVFGIPGLTHGMLAGKAVITRTEIQEDGEEEYLDVKLNVEEIRSKIIYGVETDYETTFRTIEDQIRWDKFGNNWNEVLLEESEQEKNELKKEFGAVIIPFEKKQYEYEDAIREMVNTIYPMSNNIPQSIKEELENKLEQAIDRMCQEDKNKNQPIMMARTTDRMLWTKLLDSRSLPEDSIELKNHVIKIRQMYTTLNSREADVKVLVVYDGQRKPGQMSRYDAISLTGRYKEIAMARIMEIQGHDYDVEM